MNSKSEDTQRENRDPISGQKGSHPVGTGVGAAAGGAAGGAAAVATGAAIGSAVGPVGTGLGVAAGAIVGGLAGKGVAEHANPTQEELYWRENHQKQPYGSQAPYDSYRDAYATGYEGYARYGISGGGFSDHEAELRREYEQRGGADRLAWDRARQAAQAAWERVHSRHEQLIGYSVEDTRGDSIGKVHSVWVDELAEPVFIGIKTGWLMGKNHVVPVHTAQVNNNRKLIRIPYGVDQVKGAPSFDPDVEIDASGIRGIYAYYGISQTTAKNQQPRPSAVEQEHMHEDASERTVELHRENLKVGKREVDAGGFRLRKIVRVETVNQPVELKREEVVVERIPAGERTSAGDADFREEDVFIPLRREEPVIAKEAQVTERVRIGKKTELEHQNVTETVRSEDVKLEHTETTPRDRR